MNKSIITNAIPAENWFGLWVYDGQYFATRIIAFYCGYIEGDNGDNTDAFPFMSGMDSSAVGKFGGACDDDCNFKGYIYVEGMSSAEVAESLNSGEYSVNGDSVVKI